MSEPQTTPVEGVQFEESDADMASALFAQLILQQSNMAMMLMGKVAHPDTGQTVKDIEAAKLFIDQLEMLEIKTKGNLTKQEEGLLKQSLMALRLAFVEAVDAKSDSSEKPAAPPAEPTTASDTKGPDTTSPGDDEHRKKFSKKY